MRTKSAKQIFDQCDKLSDELMMKSWDGKQYSNQRYNAMFDRINAKCTEYINNIFAYMGTDQTTCPAYAMNIIYQNQYPASVYMGKKKRQIR